MKNIMGTSVLASVLITIGCVLLVLGTLPVENKIEGKNLIVKYVIGKKVIDISDAVVMPVPEDVNHNIIRVGGTSIGKKHSGIPPCQLLRFPKHLLLRRSVPLFPEPR